MLHQPHAKFLLNVPKGKEAGTETGNNEGFDRVGASHLKLLVQLSHVYSAIVEYAFQDSSRTCSRLAPDQRQSLKISWTFHSFNRSSQLRVRDSSGKDRNDFIRHKLLKANPWTPLMALHQTESHAVFSKVVQYFFCVSNDELKTGVRVVMTESNEDPRHKMSGQSCARRQFHSSRDFSGLI